MRFSYFLVIKPLIHRKCVDNADTIPYVTAEKLSSVNHTLGTVRIKWAAPEKPNGLIVSYTIRYQRVDLEHSKGQDICITHRLYQNFSGEYLMKHLENGNYSFIVMATSLAGPGPWTAPAYENIHVWRLTNLWYFLFLTQFPKNLQETRFTNWHIFLIVCGSLALLLSFVGIGWFFMYRKYSRPVSDLKLIASVNPEYVSMQYHPDEWEVPRDNIIQLRELGQGSFGMVSDQDIN